MKHVSRITGSNNTKVLLHKSGQALITELINSLIYIQNGLKLNV